MTTDYPPFDLHLDLVKSQLWRLQGQAWGDAEKMETVSQIWAVLAEAVQARSSHRLDHAEVVIRHALALCH
jgi:hypothetical protein